MNARCTSTSGFARWSAEVHRAAVAHVHALELGVRPVAAARRDHVGDHDHLGVLTTGQQLD